MLKTSNNILLGVNIDHVATLRQARFTKYPEVLAVAFAAEMGGADGITVHLRQDRRHINERDVLYLKDMIATRLNLEMAISLEMLAFAAKVKPTYCCLVPENRQELTTEGGLNVFAQIPKVKAAIAQLSQHDIITSLFIDPDIAQIDAAIAADACVIEVHTGAYSDAKTESLRQQELIKITKACEYASSKGLIVNAGHGLNYQNVTSIAALPQINELNIGHSIVAMAIFSGFEKAVARMKQLMQAART